MAVKIEWKIIWKFSKRIIEKKDGSLPSNIRNGITQLKNYIRVWCFLPGLF